ncbi:MAG: 30S ribosomal protein S12 methylthiotransferase RimO [Bacteroidales bacterium]|nr:30S ribosomal protein S12 methylthiotransferase RimO [Bacteroidales bacterium]
MKTKKDKINIITLGCSKNLVDSEQLMRQLDANGYGLIHDGETNSAKIAVINTCGFIGDAKEESVNTILQFIEAKKQGKIDKVFVMGCLSERYKKELSEELPEADAMFGVNNLEEIVVALGGNFRNELVGERVLSTPGHYAYLKVSEGCDRACSFCAIPLIRGRHISKTEEEIIAEARFLAKKGVKELMLIAQDLTYYGIDIYRKQKLPSLLHKLADIKELEWIRLHYAYPASFPKEIARVIKERGNICNYLDIPFQHISNKVLGKMRRGVDSTQTYELISFLKEEIPGLVLRSTLMVGHPGEGEKEFRELKEFVEKARFDRLGVFEYSEEEDTYAANNFRDTVPHKVKQQRAGEIMKLQEDISLEKNLEKVGKRIKIIIDRNEGNYWIGRSEGDSPEVDNEVLVSNKYKLEVGKFYDIEITSADSFDLYAKL